MRSKRPSPEFKRFHEAVMRWRNRFWLTHWTFNIEMDDGPAPVRGAGAGTTEELLAAEVHCSPEYHTVTVTGYKDAFKRAYVSVTDQIEETACHELVHVVNSRADGFVTSLIDQLPENQQEFTRGLWRMQKEELATTWQMILMQSEGWWNEKKDDKEGPPDEG